MQYVQAYSAHIAQGPDGVRREHGLTDHLSSVAALAVAHAAPFGGERWARLAGLWHDLGKFRLGFQRYLRQSDDAHIEGRVPDRDKTHSGAGALLAMERCGPSGRVVAYVIAGHHAGLYDWPALLARLKDPDTQRERHEACAAAPAALLQTELLPDLRQVPGGRDGFALWLRMLFSALVDADFLDTEAFMDPAKSETRASYPDIASLAARFDGFMAAKSAAAPDTQVNRLRREVLQQCRQRATSGPGLYSLTVPTGGGKTLSSLAFALTHARVHRKRRIVYAIPYTSIVEQTVDVFADIFGGENVVEHHSQAESEECDETARSRLSCENWDAPLVVTTNVQLFESLFAARTSRCRKLHNLCDSVLILDEAQCLPPEFLQPILDMLNLLTRHYGVTVVLCTATQPALASRTYFDARRNRRGLDAVAEIMDDPASLHRDLRRVRMRLPSDWRLPVQWEALAGELAAQESVLAIVNTRRDARELWRCMPDGTLHLSALMCGAHRARVIAEIRRRLVDRREHRDDRPLRVVSTQLVEAGVDIDFPVVYRAVAGLDSLAQAAGRCNREGRLAQGEVVVFVPPRRAPPGLLRLGEEACQSVLHAGSDDPLAPELFTAYFDRLYHDIDLDRKRIVKDQTPDSQLSVLFRTVAANFRLIEDEGQAPVFVRDPRMVDIVALLGRLERDGPERWLMRRLQRCAVTVRERDLARLVSRGDIAEVAPGCFVQRNDLLYDPMLGLQIEGNALPADRLVL